MKLYIKEEMGLKSELNNHLMQEESQLRQKSREIWLQLGDKNSRFFHASIMVRQARNYICQLYISTGRRVSNYEELRNVAPNYYNNLFNQVDHWRIFPKLVVKMQLTEAAQCWLIRDVTHNEVKQALFQCTQINPLGQMDSMQGSSRGTGTVCHMMSAQRSRIFFLHGKLLKEVNHTFVTLIPKIKKASTLTDFRPISYCNVIYKIIAKMSSNRLQMVIGEFVSLNQSAFIKGRNISDCSLLAQELIRDFKKKLGCKAACIKIDLHKAFDTLNREFVYFMMHCMKFPFSWINWIRECIISPSFSIIVNGSPEGYLVVTEE